MSGIDAVEVALAYGCALKPETVVKYVNDNVEILQTVQVKHTDQIKALTDQMKEQGDQMKVLMDKWGSVVPGN